MVANIRCKALHGCRIFMEVADFASSVCVVVFQVLLCIRNHSPDKAISDIMLLGDQISSSCLTRMLSFVVLVYNHTVKMWYGS